MAIKIVLTEFMRDLQNSTSTFVFSLLLGFTLVFVSQVSGYLNKIFESPRWNADLVILPKGISPELAVANIIKGSPDGLIPLALFKTLLQDSQGSSVKILGFIPFIDTDGGSAIAVTDKELKNFGELKTNSIWSDFQLADLEIKRAGFQPKENYQTPEWHDQVLMGILAKGSTSDLKGLKNLIDRRTIAQAFFVGSENSVQHAKLGQLKKGLFTTTAFVFLSAALGLLLALRNINSKRRSLELVLTELKFKPTIIWQIKLLQGFAFFILPILIGFALSKLSFEIIQSFIFNI